MDVTDDAEGPLDPRIQIELENLNTATDDINKLEIELDEAHTTFNKLLSDSTRELKEIANKVGPNTIEKARCYYEAVEVARRAQVQCQHQAHLFQRASEIHAAAKETVALAETRFMANKNEWNFDQAWQDMLNHATIKVMDADNQKAECGREHRRRATLFHDAEKKAQQLEEKHKRSIIKARLYFELLSHCDQKLSEQKERVECLKKAVKEAKQAYSKSFRTLEDISNQIHQQRRDYDIMVNGPREPGVGAELINNDENLNYTDELNKITISRLNSTASSEQDIDDRAQDIDDIIELKQRMENIGKRSVDGSETKSNQWDIELQASMEKLNNLTKKNDWQCDKENTNTINLPSTSKFNLPLNELTIDDKKVPIDFQILKKVAINTTQSLTQSPINSIINKSKIAIKNSLSKSLNNSPVNIGFNFIKNKNNVQEKLSDDKEKNNTEINYDNYTSNASINENKLILNNDNTFDELNLSKSVNSSPVKTTLALNQNKLDCMSASSSNNFVDKPKFKEPNYKTSSIKELPLLSLFDKSNNITIMTKDKSCSLINLNDRNNLKTMLDNNSELDNIQAVSVERLANARHNLMLQNNK